LYTTEVQDGYLESEAGKGLNKQVKSIFDI